MLAGQRPLDPGPLPSSRSSPAATEPLHKALDQGRVDEEALQRLLVEHREPDWPLVFAVDASTWARCDAECSPERGFYCSACKHSAGQPIVAGWSYQWINQLPSLPALENLGRYAWAPRGQRR